MTKILVSLLLITCAHLSLGADTLQCYQCDSHPILGDPQPDCLTITDDKYLHESWLWDPDPEDESGLGFYTYCTLREGVQGNDARVVRSMGNIQDANADGTCREESDWTGTYKVCYCKSNKCNGGTVADIEGGGNGGEAAGNPGDSYGNSPEDSLIKELKCYDCDTHPDSPFALPRPDCEGVPKLDYLVNVIAYDQRTYCYVEVTEQNGERKTKRSAIHLNNNNGEAWCDEALEDDMHRKVCYCQTDGCNEAVLDMGGSSEGGSGGEGGDGGDGDGSDAGEEDKEDGAGGETSKDLYCYSCATHPWLPPSISPSQPDCEGVPRAEYLQKVVPTYDFESMTSYCHVEVIVRSNGIKETTRGSRVRPRTSNDTWCEEEVTSTTAQKICFCRSDGCNNQIIDVGIPGGDDGTGGTTTPGNDNGTGRTTTPSNGDATSKTTTSSSGNKDPESNCSDHSYFSGRSLLALHVVLVSISACFAAIAVYGFVMRAKPKVQDPPSYFAVIESTKKSNLKV